MARPLISTRTINLIGVLRDRGWATARATQDPQIDVIIYHDGVEDPLEPQEVVLDWPDGKVARWSGDGAAGAETVLPLIMSRTITDGFDVQVGDRAQWPGFSGEVTGVHAEGGRILAMVMADTGTA